VVEQVSNFDRPFYDDLSFKERTGINGKGVALDKKVDTSPRTMQCSKVQFTATQIVDRSQS
jgi:hypothetical protein